MARLARVVAPGCWHHITQRGNHREFVFFEDADRALYLRLLREQCGLHDVQVAGYCLMGNHIHLLAIPQQPDGLAKALGRTHRDYARWLNLRRGQTGHVWQERYYSCPLEDRHRWDALRYVELNPVRAGLVRDATEWPWSSASAHTDGVPADEFPDLTEWRDWWNAGSWREALDVGVDDAKLLERIRAATRTGRPVGADDFVEALELETGRSLRPASAAG